ncbi:MAG: TIGR01458 family HAD-type hydrolase [Aquirhabdus sp.]
MKSIRLVLLDLDGTLYIDHQVIEGAVEAVSRLREQGYTLRFLTNTTTRPQADLHQQLERMGFNLDINELISAPVAAVLELRTLQQQLGRKLRIWPVVAQAIEMDFAEFERDELAPDFIVMGDIGDAWSAALINQLFSAMHSGAKLIALHKNRFWQTQNNLKVDIGYYVAGLEYVTGQTAQVMGKPSTSFFNRVLADMNVAPDQVVLVGDDLDSDIGGAQRHGMQGILVKTGKFRQQYLEQSPIQPDGILPSIAELPEFLATHY